jgi:hypothetical protein
VHDVVAPVTATAQSYRQDQGGSNKLGVFASLITALKIDINYPVTR